MSLPMAVLIEDSPEFVVMGERVLVDEGFDVEVASDGESGVDMVRRLQPELVLIDINLPGIDGFEVCRRVRDFSDAYVLMVTGRTEEIEEVDGYRSGADDYVTKPYSPAVLAARIGAMRRRPRTQVASTNLAYDGLSIDLAARQVFLDSTEVALTKIEFDLLELLASSPRKAFNRVQLLEYVWGSAAFGDDHVIDVHMANLRRKLHETASRPRFLHTVRGVGYRFEPHGS